MGSPSQIRCGRRSSIVAAIDMLAAALLLATFPSALFAQAAEPVGCLRRPRLRKTPNLLLQPTLAKNSRARSDRRRAAKLYLAASKLFMDEHFEDAMQDYEQAAKLDPGNANYRLAADVARSHAVTALIQVGGQGRGCAAMRRRPRSSGSRTGTRSTETLKPRSISTNWATMPPARSQGRFTSRRRARLATWCQLAPEAGLHSFHLRAGQRQIIQQVFKAYGIDATTDDSVQSTPVRLRHRRCELLDSHAGPGAGHQQLLRSARCAPRAGGARHPDQPPGVHASGDGDRLSLRDEGRRDDRGEQPGQAGLRRAAGPVDGREPARITIRAPADTLEAFNSTIRELIDGHSQVLLDVRLIQLAHIERTQHRRHAAAELFSVQRLCRGAIDPEREPEPGAADHLFGPCRSRRHAGDSGHSACLRPGIQFPVLKWGGAVWRRAHAVRAGSGRGHANLNLNSSDSRELDQIQLRLGDGEAGTLKEGERYPIQTSSFSSLSAAFPTFRG